MSFYPPFTYMNGEELATLIKSGAKASTDYAIVDVRDDDRIGGHIVESHHQPSLTFIDNVQGLLEKMKNVPKVVFHCALSQERGPKAARIYAELRSEMEEREDLELKQSVFVLRGGFTEFQLRYRNDPVLVESWDKAHWGNN